MCSLVMQGPYTRMIVYVSMQVSVCKQVSLSGIAAIMPAPRPPAGWPCGKDNSKGEGKVTKGREYDDMEARIQRLEDYVRQLEARIHSLEQRLRFLELFRDEDLRD
jgi:TolA-binding protein